MGVRWKGVRVLGAAAVAAFLVAGALAAATGGWPTRQEGGDLIVETTHYCVRTDLGPEVGQAVASHQEALFLELYRRMNSIKASQRLERFDVWVFGTYERYLDEVGDSARGSQGFFIKSRDLLACWGSADQLDMICRVLRHEGTHQFVSHFIGRRCPIWLNEGLAVFYEEGQFRGGRLQVGQVPADRLSRLRRAIQADERIPLKEMLRMSDEEWRSAVQAGDSRAGLQYDQAWAMVHFLAYGGQEKYRSAFLQFIYYLSRGREASWAWESTFGNDDEAFERSWRQYVQDLCPSAEQECRTHLRILGLILQRVGQNSEWTRDLPTFRQALREGKLGRWSLKTSDGIAISSDDREKLAALFHCPEDTGGPDTISYEWVPPKEGELPILRCRHHSGVVLETRYVEDPKTGKADVQVVAHQVEENAHD